MIQTIFFFFGTSLACGLKWTTVLCATLLTCIMAVNREEACLKPSSCAIGLFTDIVFSHEWDSDTDILWWEPSNETCLCRSGLLRGKVKAKDDSLPHFIASGNTHSLFLMIGHKPMHFWNDLYRMKGRKVWRGEMSIMNSSGMSKVKIWSTQSSRQSEAWTSPPVEQGHCVIIIRHWPLQNLPCRVSLHGLLASKRNSSQLLKYLQKYGMLIK